jgi:fatty-acid desaturase
MIIEMRWHARESAWVLAMLLPALWWGPSVATPLNLGVAAGLILITVLLGHTVGLHRGIIHRAFVFGPGLRRVFIVLFALTGLGGPIAWMRQHALRDHYQSQRGAPATLTFDHGVFIDLWWTLFCSPVVDWNATDLRVDDDGFARWVDWAFYPIQIVQALIIGMVLGWQGVVIAWCARNALVMLGHWWVGYLAHTTGSRAYRIDGVAEEGRNLGFLGVLSMGEGFHNNHHAAPTCARIGREWWQLDLGWYAICGLQTLGLVWDVHHPEHQEHWLRSGARVARSRADADNVAVFGGPSGGSGMDALSSDAMKTGIARFSGPLQHESLGVAVIK